MAFEALSEAFLLRLLVLWFGTVFVHLSLVNEASLNPQTAPFNDVNLYEIWADQALNNHQLLGLNTAWVYPFVSLGPIILAKLLGATSSMLTGWLILITSLNLIVLSALVNWGRGTNRSFIVAGYYLLFLLLLGPVSIGRIDAVAGSLAILGLVQLQNDRPMLASSFFTLGAWIKIWPVAGVIAVFSASKAKLRTIAVAAITSLAIIGLGFALGANESLLSFITMQGARGLQVESIAATFWVWAAHFGAPGAGIYFDTALVTNQVTGVLSAEVANLLSYVMAGALAITIWLGLRAHRAGANQQHAFVLTWLTATLDLIVFNKVGSPQFELWLAVPLAAGLLFELPKWKRALAAGALIALLTNLIYPVFYMDLMGLGMLGIWLLTLRNLALVALLVWSNLRLTKLGVKADLGF